MTPRSIRRAAERKTKKALKKAAATPIADTTAPIVDIPAAVHVAAIRAEINKENAQHSTGPRTPEGKAKSSLNAVTSALTGRTVLLASDDVAAYERLLLECRRDFRPDTPRECALVQSIADTEWRLARIPALEMAIFAQGQLEFAAQVADHAPAIQRQLIDLKTFTAYEKQLRNLQIQEGRLERRRSREIAELKRMREERLRRERTELEQAAQLYLAAQHDHKTFDPAAHGFEFSNADIEQFLANVRASKITAAAVRKDGQPLQAAA